MKKNISIAVALVVVLGTFISQGLLPIPTLFPKEDSKVEKLDFLEKIDNLVETAGSKTFTRIQAWSAFSAYRDFAKDHNLPGVTALSYQISPACTDPSRVPECNGLMDSVYFFTQNFTLEDFKNFTQDDDLFLLYTDYTTEDEGATPVRYVIFFTPQDGILKVRSIKFCLGADTSDKECLAL